jgi:hypothetical protein
MKKKFLITGFLGQDVDSDPDEFRFLIRRRANMSKKYRFPLNINCIAFNSYKNLINYDFLLLLNSFD